MIITRLQDPANVHSCRSCRFDAFSSLAALTLLALGLRNRPIIPSANPHSAPSSLPPKSKVHDSLINPSSRVKTVHPARGSVWPYRSRKSPLTPLLLLRIQLAVRVDETLLTHDPEGFVDRVELG